MNRRHAFSLLELLISLSIVAMVLGAAITGLPEIVLARSIAAEDALLADLQRDIVRSFDSADFDTENIAALAGEVPAGTALTHFSPSLDPVYTSTAASDWFAKVARLRGFTPTTAAPTPADQPALAALLYNRPGRARLLIAAPAEPNRQRFLLISLHALPEKLALPPFTGTTADFDAIWHTEWESRTAALPVHWAARLDAPALAAWSGNLFRLRVVRITLPRYTLNVSNGHATHHAYLYWNGAAVGTPSLTRLAGAGSIVSPGILGGRIVRVCVGTSEAGATEVRRIQLRQNNDVIIQ